MIKPKKFTVEELLEDASLSQMNTTEDDKYWNSIIDFLLKYKKSEEHSEFLWANQVSHVDKEDSIEWNTNMKINDAD